MTNNIKPTHIDDKGNKWAIIGGHWHRLDECAEGWLDWIKDDSSALGRKAIDNGKTLMQILLDADFEWPEGAEYVAQDGDGRVFSYRYKPSELSARGKWVSNKEIFYERHPNREPATDWDTSCISRDEYLLAELDGITEKQASAGRVTSDGSTASYYELPEGATELQHLISHRNMNAQIGEIFRACYRYGQASHSDQLRDAKKILFYAEAEVERLESQS